MPACLRCQCVLLLLTSLAALATGGGDAAPGEAALKKLEEQAADPSGDRGILRRGLQKLRREHPGTQVAVRAAALLRALPSPLDSLSVDGIPEHERFRSQGKELVAIAGDHRGRHGQNVTAVAFSSDGKRLASVGTYHVRIWDAATMRLETHHMHHYCTSAQFSKDGKQLAVGYNGGVLVFDIPAVGEAKLKHAIAAGTGGASSVAVHPSGKYVAASCYDGTVRVYDISKAKAEEHAQTNGHRKAAHAVAYSPDGKLLASASEDATIRVWDHATHSEKSRIEVVGGIVPTALTFSPKGGTLASGYADGTVRFWTAPPSARPKVPRVAFSSGKSRVASLAYSGTGNTMAIANSEPAARIWLVSGKAALKAKAGDHLGACNCAALSPDGRILASGGADTMVRTYDASKAKLVERFVAPGHLGHTYGVAFSPDGDALLSGGTDKQVRIWDAGGNALKPRPPIKGDPTLIYAVAWSPDGKLVAAATGAKVRQWETAATARPRTSLPMHPTTVTSVEYSPDGKRLLTVAGKDAFVSDPINGGIEHRLDAAKRTVYGAAFSADGKRVGTISGSYVYDDKGRILIKDSKYVYEDCQLRLFGLEKGDELKAVKDWDIFPRGLAFSPDGKEAWAGDGVAAVRRFRTEGDKLDAAGPNWTSKSGAAYALFPSPDGKTLLVTTSSVGFQLVDVASGKTTKEFSFTEYLGGIAWAPDSRHLAVGLGTGSILVMRLDGPTRK